MIINGYTFRKEKIINDKKIWRCTEYRKARCMSRCHTKYEVITKQPTEHNHVTDKATVEAKKVIGIMKDRAATSTEATHQIVAKASAGLSVAVSAQLPAVNRMKQTIRRVRHEHQAPLPNPTSLDVLTLPIEYKTTVRGDNFLLHDSGPGDKRMLIFSTTRNLELLEQCPHWYADGTFKTSPPLFTQVYTIHAISVRLFAWHSTQFELTHLVKDNMI